MHLVSILLKEYLRKKTWRLADLKNKSIITLNENSAIIAVTNGFHGRTSFKKKGERVILFHQFNRSFDKLSYLNFFNYSKNNTSQ